MKIEVIQEVTACDIDRQTPALTYTITASDGRSISVDLCGVHSENVENLLTDFGQTPEAEPEPAKPVRPEPKQAAPARRAPEKKASPAKKTTSRRRPKVVSLEEIEASKKG